MGGGGNCGGLYTQKERGTEVEEDNNVVYGALLQSVLEGCIIVSKDHHDQRWCIKKNQNHNDKRPILID